MKRPRKPKPSRVQNANWTVQRALVEDIDTVFDNPAKLAGAIGVSPPTWNRIFSRAGVKRKTAENVVKDFFDLVCRIHEGHRPPEGASERIAMAMYEKYRERIIDHNYKQFLEPIGPPQDSLSQAISPILPRGGS